MKDKKIRAWFGNDYIDLFIPEFYLDDMDEGEVDDFIRSYINSMLSIQIMED